MSVLSEFLSLRPVGGFGFVMADPAWLFELHSQKGEGKAPQAHYRCMSVEDICALPVQHIVAKDCILWLWATNPMLREALQVLEAWGFEFATAGTWVKRTVHGHDAFGTGYVFRSSNEPILIGRRGRPKSSNSIRSAVASYEGGGLVNPEDVWPRVTCTIEAVAREHSRKPDEAFAVAEQMMPDVPRIELFSRQRRAGWASWGDETGKFEPGEVASPLSLAATGPAPKLPASLPESVREIAEVIGHEAAVEFIGKLPPAGDRSWRRCVYIPKKLTERSPLLAFIDRANAERLVEHFGGETLQPANLKNLERFQRNVLIEHAVAGGVTVDEICALTGLSDRQVRSVVDARGPVPVKSEI